MYWAERPPNGEGSLILGFQRGIRAATLTNKLRVGKSDHKADNPPGDSATGTMYASTDVW
jgi:hypothetical protein